ncbi:DUF2975 domain-containing protein [Arthrobacter flavus]|uniref:DUF2975 domain-containing protein n=1 Tax=Arthrobacter flavus TaxID=95172 RepID=A0ABW4Q9T8_9MICC
MTKQKAFRFHFFLVVFALTILLAQLVVIPRTAATYAKAYPEVAYLAPPTVTALVIALIGFEVALLAAWRLVAIAVAGKASTLQSRQWARIMTVSLILMAAIFAGVFFYMGSIAGVGGPAMLFGLLVSLALILMTFSIRHRVTGWLKTADTLHRAN